MIAAPRVAHGAAAGAVGTVSAGPIRSQLICDELVWDKAIFFSSLRINLSAARLFLLVWTSTSRTSPSAPDSLIGDHDPAFRQQIFDVAEATA